MGWRSDADWKGWTRVRTAGVRKFQRPMARRLSLVAALAAGLSLQTLVAMGDSIQFIAITLQPYHGTVSNSSTEKITGPTSVRLPIYPGAAPAGTGPETTVNTLGTAYLRAGSARFVVRANLKAVRSWYTTEMTRHGFVVDNAKGSLAPGAGRAQDLYTAKADSGLIAELDFSRLAANPNKMVIEYWVTDAVNPPRPQASFVPTDVKQAVVRYQPVSLHAPNPWITKRIVTQQELAALTRSINALPVDTRTAVTNESSLYGGVTLRFVSGGGRGTTVVVDFQRNQVRVNGGPTLFDAPNTVWTTISADMGYRPYLSG